MYKKLALLFSATMVGFLFAFLNIPAGWLIGSLLFSIFFRMTFGHVALPSRLFDIAMALIGTNIGLTMNLSMVPVIAGYALPLTISLIIMLIGSWLLSRLLAKSSQIDHKTALFCCMPGGASVMMALSEQYHADQPIVAAFQSARVIMLVSTIPIFAGIMASPSHHHTVAKHAQSTVHTTLLHIPDNLSFIFVILIISTAIWLSTKLRIAAGSFLYAMVIGLLVNEFIVFIPTLPDVVIGIGQVVLGVIIGLRFDKQAFLRLKQAGLLSIIVLLLYLGLSFIISVVFYSMTSVDFVTSLLSMVPGGAPQMASTASLLHLDSSTVASLQLVRLLIIFLLIPIIIPILVNEKQVKHEQ